MTTKLEELKAAAEAIAAELEATADTYEAELEAAADTYEAELKAVSGSAADAWAWMAELEKQLKKENK